MRNKPYTRLDMIGRGGTSRVYKVVSPGNEILALKRVQIDHSEPETMNGYMNEIRLLKRLDGNDRIIRLIDSDTKTTGSNKALLLLLMELGEIDVAKLLQEQQKRPVDFVWVAYYFKQMLEAVHVIHEEKIIHSDLKPANFVLVKGQLKLIDFGIANAIANDTTNVHRDHQVGTVNYMSPETIENPDGRVSERHFKVGRASDVWSLGCILYQMVYGHPPFHYCSGIVQKMKAIPDPNVPIQFPTTAIINTMKRCLARNAKERATIPELLMENWLTMRERELSISAF
ncbi:kinase-like domain-containing protein [Irpex rosettiformis]|uniref:Kinase-like domain-containing protein n=1 Tax=Irpex rosettiformis TaxID=378272 RepID=A0ACB8TWX4_9APHY|nr:kinase-like domain-containing protein [Irpex rosettiformis]